MTDILQAVGFWHINTIDLSHAIMDMERFS
jgi:hypothetical protein